MKQGDKRLLLIDLSARLPYGVLVHYCNKSPIFYTSEFILNERILLEYRTPYCCVELKPYLRPMSSITEKEKEEWYKESHVDYDCEFQPTPTLVLEHCHLSTDWLNAHHFDYRSLIKKGLAIEAPEGMYKFNE